MLHYSLVGLIIITAATNDHEADDESLNTEIPVSQVRVQNRPAYIARLVER